VSEEKSVQRIKSTKDDLRVPVDVYRDESCQHPLPILNKADIRISSHSSTDTSTGWTSSRGSRRPNHTRRAHTAGRRRTWVKQAILWDTGSAWASSRPDGCDSHTRETSEAVSEVTGVFFAWTGDGDRDLDDEEESGEEERFEHDDNWLLIVDRWVARC
jgi:hypothetical protein